MDSRLQNLPAIERELDNAARELAERYEEINLLYTISEILGRTVDLSETASIILQELTETVGALKGAILLCESKGDELTRVAWRGFDDSGLPKAVRSDATDIVAAQVVKTGQTMVLDGEMSRGDDAYHSDPFRDGAMLSVPIIWKNVNGTSDRLGVIILTGRRSKSSFSAGDIKLVVAVATQVGSAIQNSRLVRQSIEQQRLLREVQLAHDLQMKLLPKASVVAPQAEVAARVVPAESVGGDFYHLFKLSSNRTGIMVGDVSGHGYGAALIMALTLSAAAIHAQLSVNPAQVLQALLSSLSDELNTTEMFVSAFYGIVDKDNGTLVYANTGHPHAFVIHSDGTCKRLKALDPPIGMVDFAPSSAACAWNPDSDLLVLFTDGVPDSLSENGVRLGEETVLQMILDRRDQDPATIVEHVFASLKHYTRDIAPLDDLTLLVLRS